jgi:hypothetical protein
MHFLGLETNMKKILAALFVTVGGLHGAIAYAVPVNLVQNGNFEDVTNGTGKFANTGNITSAGTTVADGWTSSGYNFIYTPGTADGKSKARGSAIPLWGSENGGLNTITVSQGGGNFFAGDGVYQAGPLQQVINNLVAGQSYILSFDYAGAQQQGFTGLTTEGWAVSLGKVTATNKVQDTAMLNDVSHGFTGWTSDTMTFIATSSSEVLSFMALGTPNGEPPVSLLDNVSLVAGAAVPEPGTLWAMLIGGLALLGVAKRRRNARQA